MKKSYLSALLIFIAIGWQSVAQTPMYFNNNTLGGSNSIPFNSGANFTWRHCQFFIPANTLTGITPGKNIITKIYYHASTAANVTFPTFVVKLKNTSGVMSGVAAGPFESGMTTVFSATNFNMVTTLNGWFGITLQVPFIYDPSMGLVVDFEHDHPNAVGPSVHQPVNIPGPGNGRQYGDINGAPISGTGATQLNFGVDAFPAPACVGKPATNSITPSAYTTCVGIPNPNLSLAYSYTNTGLEYQWYSSTISPVGPFNAIPGATAVSVSVPTIGVHTWYQVAITCTTPGGQSNSLTPSALHVAGSSTSTAPYFEDFENLQMEGRLPNCSWSGTSLNNATNSYIGANTGNRAARSGTKYASFKNVAGTHLYYTHPIMLHANVTYSASLWYQTDLAGSNNFKDLEIMLGTSQSSTGLTPIAAVNGAVISPSYKPLSNVFTVSSSGLYHVAVKVDATAGGAPYLSWDDLSISIPCTPQHNVVNLTLSANNQTVCQNSPVLLTATGAHTYSWSTGATGPSQNFAPMATGMYGVIGTNTLTQCSSSKSIPITVLNVPNVVATAFPANSCAGKKVTLIASGADNYVWSTTGAGPHVTVSPSSTSAYQVIGTGTNNCNRSATVVVQVNPNPLISASLSNEEICFGESIVLTGSGADTYEWVDAATAELKFGNNVVVFPRASGGYSVTGKDANGCEGTTFVGLTVMECVGLKEHAENTVKVYPNPANESFVVEAKGIISTLEICDISGRVVYKLAVNATSGVANIAELTPGVYTVKATTTDGVDYVRILKQ